MRNIVLTIAIPNYNGAENIIRAITSCQHVGLGTDEFEILVVDNASEDKSVDIVESLEKKFNNIKLVVNKANIGRIGNWNRCLDLARGEYIMFLFPTEEIFKTNNIAASIDKMRETGIILAKSDVVCRGGLGYACIKGKRAGFKRKNFKHTLRNAMILSGSLPFGPLQSFIIKLGFIKENNIRFDKKYNIVGDQDFIIGIGDKNAANAGGADYLLTENTNIIFDDNFGNRTHNRLSIYSRLNESLDLIVERGYYRFIGFGFDDIVCFVLAQLRLVDKIFGNRRERCGTEIYEKDKTNFYKKYHHGGNRVLLVFLLTSWVKILMKIVNVAKNLTKFDIVCIMGELAADLSARRKTKKDRSVG